MRIQTVQSVGVVPSVRGALQAGGPCHFVLWETGPLGKVPSPGRVRTDVVATSKDIVGLKLILRPRTLRAAELAKCWLGPHYSTAAVPQLVPQ